nr:Protein NEP-11, isoform a [Haemonchus contortus]
MPFGDPPDYVHLRTNESQMQLISMGEQPETPSGSPCFNAPSTREDPPAVVFVPGKRTFVLYAGLISRWLFHNGFEVNPGRIFRFGSFIE